MFSQGGNRLSAPAANPQITGDHGHNEIAKTVGTAGALGALALGGSALADAASTTTTTSSGAQPRAAQKSPTDRRANDTTPDGHKGANGKTEAALSADIAVKVKAAGEKKMSGGTVLRVETDVDHGSPYEAHVRKSDATEVEVFVDKGFTVTAVNAMGGQGGPQHP